MNSTTYSFCFFLLICALPHTDTFAQKNENSIELYAREKFGYIKKRESFVQIIKNDQK